MLPGKRLAISVRSTRPREVLETVSLIRSAVSSSQFRAGIFDNRTKDTYPIRLVLNIFIDYIFSVLIILRTDCLKL